ncbi:MAG: glycosyltransferase [Qipengyuania pacifica]
MLIDEFAAKEVRQSGFFDEDWYLREYPDVARQDIGALEHFVWLGGKLKRDPGPLFSTEAYLAAYPDVENAGILPLLHYIQYGKSEGRRISRSGGGELPAGFMPSVVKSGRNEAGSQRDVGRVLSSKLIILLSGEPLDRPGALYRINRLAESFKASGCETEIVAREDVDYAREMLDRAAILFVWRAKWPDIAQLVRRARKLKVPFVFDVDDLMVRPDLARAEYIDAIRFNRHDEAGVRKHYSEVQEAMSEADYCTASTRELAWHMRSGHRRRPTFVIPNTFDVNTYKKSRVAVRGRAAEKDGLLRIGYASGSRTHQADFKLCSDAVADVLRRHPKAVLVLFRRNTLVTLDLSEFPEFEGLEDRIEWREFVPLPDLPNEVARFDINLAPLEHGNPFCESKSELKYFEAAIADVPTIASPTGPYKWAIDHGRTGYLADTQDDWFNSLERLIGDTELRLRIARQAHRAAIWDFGPTRRTELVETLLDHVKTHRRASRAMHFEQNIQNRRPLEISINPYETLRDYNKGLGSRVTIVVPLYNYEQYIIETLESAKEQTMSDIDLIVVDDHSSDSSAKIVARWLDENHECFNRGVLVKHTENSGLGASRNTGFDLADTLYIMALDADNKLKPECCEKLHAAANGSKSAFAYSIVQQFGDADGQMGIREFSPAEFIPGNVIDAMALISKEVWSLVGGFATHRMGWQDYDFWCRIVDVGLPFEHVPEVLSEYRVHGQSMLRTSTDRAKNKADLIKEMEAAYSWLSPIDARKGHRIPLDEVDQD